MPGGEQLTFRWCTVATQDADEVVQTVEEPRGLCGPHLLEALRSTPFCGPAHSRSTFGAEGNLYYVDVSPDTTQRKAVCKRGPLLNDKAIVLPPVNERYGRSGFKTSGRT